MSYFLLVIVSEIQPCDVASVGLAVIIAGKSSLGSSGAFAAEHQPIPANRAKRFQTSFGYVPNHCDFAVAMGADLCDFVIIGVYRFDLIFHDNYPFCPPTVGEPDLISLILAFKASRSAFCTSAFPSKAAATSTSRVSWAISL